MIARFFKGLGKGILNILIIPFYLIAWALSAVAGIFIYIFEFFKKFIKFVSGKSVSNDLPEDIEAKEVIENNKKPKQDNDVQVVRAEIADPSVDYKEVDIPRRIIPSRQISQTQDETVDFLLEDEPLVIETKVDEPQNNIPAIENKKIDEEESIDEEENTSDEDEIEEYNPKAAEF